MTTGATGQLGLALPVQGELSGTWGDTVNNGITQYTNIAIAATLTLTNDGAVTLANTTGDASASNITSTLTGAGTVTAQFAIVRVTGTLTTAKVVTAPSYSKTYTVVNAATGGIVTFKAAGQTGVSIAVGESAFVYYNGTDYVKVSGTSAVSSFSAGTTGLTPNTATTGAVTLAGTLGTANGGTNLGGATPFTSGGVLYASSTSALATGSTLNFDGTNLGVGESAASADGSKLIISGNVPVSTQLGIKINGNATTYAQQAIRFYDTYSTQYAGYIGFTPSSLTFGQGTTEGMRLTSTGLGIGTTSPGARLDVDGSIIGQAVLTLNSANTPTLSQSSNKINLTGAGTSIDGIYMANTGGTFCIAMEGSSGNQVISATPYASGMCTIGATPLVFGANNAERVRISSAGGFSVGTTADPGAGAIYATGNITAYYSDKRLKTVSGKIENALDKVAQLSGVYYTNNDTAKSFGYDSDEVQVGVLAQDVEAVLPQIVKAAPFDLDEHGNSKSGENYKTVQYERLVPLLIEAINELRAEVKALKGA